MPAFIITGGSQTDRVGEVATRFPSSRYRSLHLTGTSESPLTITALRDLFTSLALTSTLPRLVWIEEAQTLTLPAQHTLLKPLEEPPHGVTFALSLPSPTSLLATIRSRCILIRLVSSPSNILNKQELSLVKFALTLSPGARIKLAHTLGKDRTELLTYFHKLLTSLHTLLMDSHSPPTLHFLTSLSRQTHLTYTRLLANSNPTLTLEAFFLSLPHSR